MRKLSEGHLLAGTHVKEVRSWKTAISYMERYVAKPERFPEGVETGRVWGTWNEDLLPVQWETVKVSLKDAYRIRRIYRRLAKMRGRGHLHRIPGDGVSLFTKMPRGTSSRKPIP